MEGGTGQVLSGLCLQGQGWESVNFATRWMHGLIVLSFFFTFEPSCRLNIDLEHHRPQQC